MGSHKKKKKKVTSVENLFITHIRSNSGLFINMKWKAHIYMDITEYNTVKINEIYVFLFPRGKKKKQQESSSLFAFTHNHLYTLLMCRKWEKEYKKKQAVDETESTKLIALFCFK